MAAEDGKVPVTHCVRSAYRFLRDNWAALTPACLVVAASSVGATLIAVSTASGIGAFLPAVISSLAGAVFAAAVLRRALRPGDSGMVQFGVDEFRLIGAAIALTLMFMPLVIIVTFVLTTVLAGQLADSPEALAAILENPATLRTALEQSLNPAGRMAFSLFVFIVVGLAVWISVRLSLVNAATIGEGRIVVLQSWSWTRGNLVRVAAAFALVMIPPALVATILVSVVAAIFGPSGEATVVGVAIVAGVQGLLSAASNIPAIALGAELYRGLRPPDFVPK